MWDWKESGSRGNGWWSPRTSIRVVEWLAWKMVSRVWSRMLSQDLSSGLYTSQLTRYSRQPRDVLHSLHWAILKEQRQRSITNLTGLCGSRQMRDVKSGCMYISRGSRGLMVESQTRIKGCEFESRAAVIVGVGSECQALSLHSQYPDWGALEQDTEPRLLPGSRTA